MTEIDFSVPDLKRRAASGAVMVGARGVALRVISLVGLLVFAKILGPADFGVVAFGLSITFLAHFLGEGGLAASLIRRVEPPTMAEYQAAVGLQAAVTTAILVVFGVAALLADNRTLTVTVLFLASVPLLTFRLPAYTALERQLRFGPSVTAEVAEVLVYNLWSIGGLLLGFGIYALGTGAIVKTLVGTAVLNAMSPVGWVMPRVRIEPLRGLLAFGLKFQGSGAVTLLRDQVLNLAIVAIAGYAMLGVWAAAGRLISVPLLLFESLVRVAFPAMSRLRDAGEASGAMTRKGVEIVAVISCGMLAPLAVVIVPAIREVLGPEWSDAAELMPWLCLALAVYGPVSVVVTAYLLADDAPGAVVVANLALSVVMLGVALPLLAVVGHWALAVAMVVAYTVGALALDRALRRRAAIHTLDRVLPALLCGFCSAAAGFAAVASVDGQALKLLAGGVAALTVYVLLIQAVSRDATRTIWTLLSGMAPSRRRIEPAGRD